MNSRVSAFCIHRSVAGETIFTVVYYSKCANRGYSHFRRLFIIFFYRFGGKNSNSNKNIASIFVMSWIIFILYYNSSTRKKQKLLQNLNK